MKTILSSALVAILAITLTGCASGGSVETVQTESATPGIYYTTNYDFYTRSDNYPDLTGGSFYSYGGRYEGGGYGNGDNDPLNH
jgi:hypothetical protein